MKDNISPEEKLLKLIKGEKKPKSPEKPISPALELKPATKSHIFSLTHKYLTAPQINKLMLTLIVMSFIYLLASFIYPWIGLSKIKLPDISKEKIEEPSLKLKEESKPYEFYLQGIGGRRIFGSPTASEVSAASGAANVELNKDINLVGIISGVNPQAIIEDKKSQKTYYVSKGQFIGEFRVEDIQEGKVILNYNGQRYELYL